MSMENQFSFNKFKLQKPGELSDVPRFSQGKNPWPLVEKYLLIWWRGSVMAY